MASNPIPRFSAEQYLEFDRRSDEPNEFIGGEIVPVQDAAPWHGRIAANASRVLDHALSPAGCTVFVNGPRVCLDRESNYAYPDVTAICGGLQYTDLRRDTVTNPKLVVEVLSPTTRSYDLGDKLRLYWDVASLTDILLVAQDRVWIEYWFRHTGGEWKKRLFENQTDTLRIESTGQEIPVAEFYSKVEFPLTS